MARFALRNQEKIKQAFGEERLNELLKALKLYSAKYPKLSLDAIIEKGKPYPYFVIDNVAVLYVTRLMYDVYHVALKEFYKQKAPPSEIRMRTMLDVNNCLFNVLST